MGKEFIEEIAIAYIDLLNKDCTLARGEKLEKLDILLTEKGLNLKEKTELMNKYKKEIR